MIGLKTWPLAAILKALPTRQRQPESNLPYSNARRMLAAIEAHALIERCRKKVPVDPELRSLGDKVVANMVESLNAASQ